MLTVPCVYFRINLYPTVFGDHFFRNRNSFEYRYSLLDNGIMFHATSRQVSNKPLTRADYSLGHAQHAIDLFYTKPMKNILQTSIRGRAEAIYESYWHQGLEPHVFDTCDVLGTLEVLACFV